MEEDLYGPLFLCYNIREVNRKTMADPYPAIGSNYRPNIEPSTTNRGLTLTAEEVVVLRDLLSHVPDPNSEVVSLYDKVKLL